MTGRPRVAVLPRLRASGDAWWLLVGSVLTSCLAYATGVIGRTMRLDVPANYSQDALAAAAQIKALIEGNPFASPRLGYPFGANWQDWPSLDGGIIGIAKLLSLLAHDWVTVFNLLFLLGFPAAYVAAYIVTRRFGLSPAFAFLAGTSYALASYHFERLTLQGHLYLSWYWVAPVFILLGWRIANPPPEPRSARVVMPFLGLALLTGFGIYYTAFGLITIIVGLVYAWSRPDARGAFGRFRRILLPMLVGIAIQLLPWVMRRLQAGANPAAMARSYLDSELWALRPVQLFLPHVTHRIPMLAEKAAQFRDAALGTNESVMSSIGIIASLGLFVLLQLLVTAIAGRQLDDRLRYLLVITAAFLAFASIGGFGLLLSMLGFTGIRSWNRLSIFIEYTGLLATCIALTPTALRYSARARRLLMPFALVVALGIVWLDQTPAPSASLTSASAAQRETEAGFVHTLEARLPAGAAVYQMPFTGFPEGFRVSSYGAYEFLKPYLESSSLRFNLGSFKGRPGDRFYRALAQRSIATQVAAARRLGFSGIYVDRTGFADGGVRAIRELEGQLGVSAALWRDDRRVVYFDLHNATPALAKGSLTPVQAEAVSGFTPRFAKRHISD